MCSMKKIKKLIPVLILSIIILVAFFPLYIKSGFIGDFGDPIGQTIPNKFLLIQYLKNGILPLWNSFSFMGFPFLADIQVGTFYIPDILIFSTFSPLAAHNISVITHLIFAGLGTYLLIKNLAKNRLITVAAGLMLVLGGTFLTKIVYLNFLETISYIPWILFLISTKNSRIWMMTLLFSLMIFAGHPIALIYSLIIIGLFLLINYPEKWKALISSCLLGAIITGIQIIPFIELKTNSVRDSLSYNQFVEGSLNFRELLGLITPFQNGIQNSFDRYINFGTIAFIVLIISILFFKNFKKADKKIYLTGIILCFLGIVLSLGKNIPFIAKFLYNLPLFNLTRVPARYMILFHFGALLSIVIFLKYLAAKHKKTATTIALFIIINSILLPQLFLERHEISDAKKEYFLEIKESIKNYDDTEFSIRTPPKYFLSSSFFLFPNRHILNFMPNLIGYNPMILKDFHNVFSVLPVGAFEDPDYLTNLYEKLKRVGLKYYIFPNKSYLKKKNLESKSSVIDFLLKHGWKKIIEKENYDIWQSPFKNDFAYFLNNSNKIELLNFSPGEINLKTKTKTDDLLIINQIYYEGWLAITNKNTFISPEKYNGYLQAYEIPGDTDNITLIYRPKSIIYGMYITIIGLMILLFLTIFENKPKKNL